MVNPVALLGVMPKIEGFSPLPSESADAFMSLQGGHMALYFGAEYTIGKRLISSMSNEDFNKAVTNPQIFINRIEVQYEAITKQFQKHIEDHHAEIQKIVLDKAYELEVLKAHLNVKLLKELPKEYFDAFFGNKYTPGVQDNPEFENDVNNNPDLFNPPGETGYGYDDYKSNEEKEKDDYYNKIINPHTGETQAQQDKRIEEQKQANIAAGTHKTQTSGSGKKTTNAVYNTNTGSPSDPLVFVHNIYPASKNQPKPTPDLKPIYAKISALHNVPTHKIKLVARGFVKMSGGKWKYRVKYYIK